MDGVPFLKNVVRWTISDAYFMSAKLLNASGWDDVLEYGKVSPWTTRQRFITIRLLNDTFVKDAGAKTHVIIAALQSLLAFEVCITTHLRVCLVDSDFNPLASHRQLRKHQSASTLLPRSHEPIDQTKQRELVLSYQG